MKICFMGTPQIAANVLSNILSKYPVDAVYTKPPALKSRGLKLASSKVHELALAKNIKVFHPASFKNNLAAVEEFINQNFDLAIVVAYGLILPKAVFSSPKYGTINLHASLLPKWRGAAPIERAIENGDSKTGVTIMDIAEGLDSGDIILQEDFSLTTNSTASTVYNSIANVGSKLLLQVIDKLNNNETLIKTPQDNNLASYAKMLKKDEGKINFNSPAINIIQKINAFEVFPGSYFSYNNETFKVIKASIAKLENVLNTLEAKNLQNTTKQGTIIVTKDSIYIKADDNFISIESLKRAGKNTLKTKEFLKGYHFNNGNIVN